MTADGGGETGTGVTGVSRFSAETGGVSDLVRSKDWSQSPIGPPADWPPSLHTAFGLMLPAMAQIVLFWGPEFVALYNDAYAPAIGDKHPRALGRPAQENWAELWDDLEPLLRTVRETGETLYAKDRAFQIERHGYSETVYFDISYSPVPEEGGGVGGVLCIVSETTERFVAEQAIRASEQRLQIALDAASAAGTWDWDIKADRVYADARFARLYSVAAERAAAGAPIAEFTDGIHPDDRDRVGAAIQHAIDTAGAFESEYRVTPADGERWVLARGHAFYNADGTPSRFPGVTIDITDRKRMEQALRESEDRLRLATEAADIGTWDFNPVTGALHWDDRCKRLFGLPPTARVDYDVFLAGVHPDDRDGADEAVRGALSGDGPDAFRYEYRTRGLEDGIERWLVAGGRAIFEGDGADRRAVRFIGTVIDITGPKRTAEALRETEERYRLAARATNDAIWDWDLIDNHVLWNEALASVFGHSGADVEETGEWWIEHIHPDDRARVSHSIHAVIDGDGVTWTDEYRFRRADGGYSAVFDRGTVIRDADGKAVRMIGAMLDQTERLRAEAALQELNESLELRVAEAIAEREQAEEALRQATKMEAVGQLTGGIAHDFNNLLTIITGNLDAARRHMREDAEPRVTRALGNALIGAERAAVLTQRLLAFSRRQPLAPKPLDPNKLVAGMSELLHRSLGETIEVETVLGGGIWRVEADPNQLENAILNLAVNARDAMPGGGKLTIETSNTHLDCGYVEQNAGVLPGQYVVICVTDTGLGMDEATVLRAFEPFFTTKDVGKGTGLGLSMVYGFVKQSGGHLKIYSEAGEGTTVKIYLPRLLREDAEDEATAQQAAAGGSGEETILVCEDDDDVRACTVDVLRELGYRVIEAHDAQSALRLLERQEGRVDLLFTDVVLPGGMTGADLARGAVALRPELKVLFTTGYARNAIVHQGRLDPGVELITKPFTYADLSARVRDILDKS